ncbi:MAG: alkaline phosphatase [Oleispira sp.]|nr:alkaline phosphatase [Oleispira sp.]MBL4881657.1 alkaline phosphatase [Oleispira sp.]
MSLLKKGSVLTLLSLLLIACSPLESETENVGEKKTLGIKDQTSSEQWFQQGKDKVQQRKIALAKENNFERKAKNIIFVLGDGMGVSTLTAARIYVGQQQGLLGEEFALSFETFPHAALIKTYNVDLQTPDSAGTMSALMTGLKTDEGIISLPASVIRGDCSSATAQDNKLPTLLDIAKSKGKSTAVVTTARITHATPATTYAHSVDRNWEGDDALPQTAKDLGCTDIATQLIADNGHSVDIILGGGRRHFLPSTAGGKRLDGKNLISQWQQKGGLYVGSLEELQQVKETTQPLLGLFASSHLSYAYQRPQQQPSLQQMTAAALTRLQKNEQGYVLIIEAGRIDHGHHDGMAYKALTETQELHETVGWLLTQVDLKETLIVVTADHSHTLTLSGYATRGNPILGHVVGNDAEGYPQTNPLKDKQGNPYTSLSYRDGPGASINRDEHDEEDLYDPNYQQMALVPMDYETHGGEDVALYAIGPQSQLFSGTLEQHWVFHALKYAM